MRDETHRIALLMTRAVWASLIICACLFGGSTPAFGQKETITTVDETYGKGGKKRTETAATDEEVRTTVRIYDGEGAKREQRETTIYKRSGKKIREAVVYYDCEGRPTYVQTISYDILGNETRFEESRYKDGQQISGLIRGTRIDGTKYSLRYNPKTTFYEDIALDAGPASDEISAPQPDTSACPVAAFQPNEIFGGFSLIREDSDPENFNTYGFDASYTRYLNERVGLTGDFNASFRERDGVELSKYSFTGGLTVLPFADADADDRVRVFVRGLAGVSHFKADFGAGSFTDNSFTAKLGGGVDIDVTKNLFVRPIEVNYNPTFFGDSTQHNVQFSFGAGFRFGR